VFSYYGMCSLTIERVLLLWNVLSFYGMCPLTMECVLLVRVYIPIQCVYIPIQCVPLVCIPIQCVYVPIQCVLLVCIPIQCVLVLKRERCGTRAHGCADGCRVRCVQGQRHHSSHLLRAQARGAPPGRRQCHVSPSCASLQAPILKSPLHTPLCCRFARALTFQNVSVLQLFSLPSICRDQNLICHSGPPIRRGLQGAE